MQTTIAVLTVLSSIAIPINKTDNLDWKDKTPFISVRGCAAYYNKGIMERSAKYWGYIDRVEDYDYWLAGNGYIGAVAAYRAGDKGRTMHIVWPDGTLDGPYLVIESVARHDYELGLERNRAVDVDYNTARRIGIKAPMNVIILYDLEAEHLDRIVGMRLPIRQSAYEGCIG